MPVNAKRTPGMRAKILILCISCTLVAMSVQTWLFQSSAASIIYRQERDATRKALENMQGDLYTWIKSYENNLIKIYSRKEFTRDLEAGLPTAALRERYNRLAYEIGQSSFNPSQYVVALYVYDMNDRVLSYYKGASTPKHNYPDDIYLSPESGNTAVVSDYVVSDNKIMLVSSYWNESRQKDIVRFVLKIYSNNLTRKIGYIVCDVDGGSLLRIMEKFAYSDRQIVWLQPRGDRPVSRLGEADGKLVEIYDQSVAATMEGSSPGQDNRSGVEGVFFDIDQEKYNLKAFSLTPQYLLEESQNLLARNVAIIALALIAVMIVSASLVSNTLTVPLRRINRTLTEIRGGRMNLRLDGLKSDEIGTLGLTINEMLDRIQLLIEEEYHAKLLTKQAEYKALQAQVNPHFLYNSLDAMSGIAASQQCHTVGELCQAMSNVFRYSIDMTAPLATVGEEIRHLKNYMYVMNVRTQNSVELDIDIDRGLLNERVPRLSLQPVVENALNHGLKNKRGLKKVIVHGEVRGEEIVLSVVDNGVGMDPEPINRSLRGKPEDVLGKSASIGLGNIHARIGLLFGESYGVRVESSPGMGSSVSLHFPRAHKEAAIL